MRFRLLHRKAAPKDPNNGTPLEQGEVQGNAGNRPGSKSDHQIAPIPTHRSDSRFAEVAPNRIINDVDAFPAGQFFDTVFQRLGAVINDVICTQLLAQRELVITARSGDHRGAQGLTQLNGSAADAARRTQNKQGFSGLNLSSLDQRVVRR